MDVTTRSTSPLMKKLFSEDLKVIIDDYANLMFALSKRYPYLGSAFLECTNRTGFLFPYMSVEYAYYSVKGCFLPEDVKKSVMSFGILGLVASIDDDVADERDDHLKSVSRICVSEVLQNVAYTHLMGIAHREETGIVINEINDALESLVRYQHLDALNHREFQEKGFDFERYIESVQKTVCPIKHGMRLGIKLAKQEKYRYYCDYISSRLGVTLQLIDDVIDLRDDLKNYRHPVTLPMFLLKNGQGLNDVFELIDNNLKESMKMCYVFPYPDRLLGLVRAFEEIARDVQNISKNNQFSDICDSEASFLSQNQGSSVSGNRE